MKYRLIISLILITNVVFAQSNSVSVDSTKKYIFESVNQFIKYHEDDQSKFVPYICFIGDKRYSDYVIGLITFPSELKKNIPSYYFLSSNGIPVYVYTGYEKYFEFSESFKKTIINSSKDFLHENDALNMHFNLWHVEVERGVLKKIHKKASKKILKTFDRLRFGN